MIEWKFYSKDGLRKGLELITKLPVENLIKVRSNGEQVGDDRI